jgi:predicted nucleic acid-binding protein
VRSFIDTNLLVYVDAADERKKQRMAIAHVRRLRTQRSGVLSTQVLQEYVHVALRKLRLPIEQVRSRLAVYERFEVVPASPRGIRAALDLTVLHKLSFYDALIVEAAARAGCAELLSEDMDVGAVIAGVRIVNPFQ